MGWIKSLFGGSKGQPPSRIDAGRGMMDLARGYQEALPSILGLEQQYRPQFLDLNLADVSQFLGGADSGLMGLFGGIQQATGEQLGQARQQELASMTGAAPTYRSFAQTLSPEAQAQVEAAQREAARATQAAGGLTGQERRGAQQMAREAYGARGMLDSNASVAGEVLNREDVLARKRAEAAGARQQAYGLASDFYSRPGMQALGSTPLSYSAGQNMLGLGLGAIGSGRPQMINPDAGINMEMAYQTNLTNYNNAKMAADAQRFSGLVGGIGSAIGGWATGGMGGGRRY